LEDELAAVPGDRCSLNRWAGIATMMSAST